jgi:hypothetical protein
MPSRIAAIRTPVTMPTYARAVVGAWPLVETAPPTREAVGVLWAQYSIETGGAACWCWNIGNVKAVEGQDYCELSGVWEGVTPAEARTLIASGQATADPSPNHAKAVAPRVSVLFQPPHPATRFRAFSSLDEAMRHHLVLLAQKRYRHAWPAVLAGDVVAFARSLKAHGYFTASAEAYAAGMKPAYAAFCKSGAFAQEAPTLRQFPDAADATPPHGQPAPVSMSVADAPVHEDDGGASRWAATRAIATGREPDGT